MSAEDAPPSEDRPAPIGPDAANGTEAPPDKWFQKAQEEERESATRSRQSLNDPQANEWKQLYWREFIQAMNWDPISRAKQLGRKLRVLDVGCGPRGIVSYLARQDEYVEHLRLHGLDPLADHYCSVAPWLRELPVTWINSIFETHRPAEPYDVILAINSIDHGLSLERLIANLAACVRQDGEVWVSVNCHTKAWRARLFQSFHLDPCHPFSYTEAEYRELFGQYFAIEDVRDTSYTLLKESLHSPKKPRSKARRVPINLRSALAPRAWVRKAICLNAPGFPREPGQESVYRTRAFRMVPGPSRP